MVGPGEVDDDLEPEIKEECHTKYGDVQSVVIFEIPNVAAEDAVRIFVEFKRVESAIKGEKIKLSKYRHKSDLNSNLLQLWLISTVDFSVEEKFVHHFTTWSDSKATI